MAAAWNTQFFSWGSETLLALDTFVASLYVRVRGTYGPCSASVSTQ